MSVKYFFADFVRSTCKLPESTLAPPRSEARLILKPPLAIDLKSGGLRPIQNGFVHSASVLEVLSPEIDKCELCLTTFCCYGVVPFPSPAQGDDNAASGAMSWLTGR
jgi:hypothetical protein